MNLRGARLALGMSQSRLARLANVSRFKICTHELGDTELNPAEQDRVREALLGEAERFRNVVPRVEFATRAVTAVGGER